MNLTLLRILFLFCALTGGFLLFRIIPVIFKMVMEKPLLRLPVADKAATFRLPAPGSYAIWQKTGSMFKSKTDLARPAIFDVTGGRGISLSKTFAMITTNDGSGTRRQLYTFSVPAAGEYRIELQVTGNEGRSISDCSFEIRKPLPVFRLVFSILGILVGFGLFAGGLVCVFMAPRLF